MGGVSILPDDPEGRGHSFHGNIRRSNSGKKAGGNGLSAEQILSQGVEVGGSGFRLIDGEKKGTARGKQGETSEKEGFKFALDAKGSSATAVGKRGGIQDNRVESFASPSQAGEDATDIFRPEAVSGSTEMVELVIFFATGERAGGGVDIQGFGTDGPGEDAEGTSVCKEVE
jgi:hypothetical protein